MSAADEGVRLMVDHATRSLQVVSLMRAHVFVAIGAAAVPPIAIAGIELDVQPHHVLDLGECHAGELLLFAIPRGIEDLFAEAVAFDSERFTLHDSNVVELEDAEADMIEATFRAELLVAKNGFGYEVDASLTAPTSAYEFVLDGVELSEVTMHVYLRLIEPGEREVTIPVLTDHRQVVALGDQVGKVVHVNLMRQRRGEIGVEVYRLMAELPVAR